MSRRNRRNRLDSERRDAFDIARRSLPLERLISPIPYSSTNLRLYEDRRQWNPEPYTEPARSFSQSRHRLRVGANVRSTAKRVSPGGGRNLWSALTWPSANVAFRQPRQVLICVRRQRRKEVLFAKGLGGRRGQRSPRFTQYSSVSCRR